MRSGSGGQPPILNTLPPQIGHVPCSAGLPFFIVIFWGFTTSTFILSLTQYASAIGSFASYLSCGAGSTPTSIVNTNFSDIALISQQQNDLSVTDVIPMSIGPPIPAYDPIVSSLLNRMHQSLPELSTVLTGGSNWLNSDAINGNP